MAEGESGELCVRGRCLALGYYNNPEKTAEAFIQNPLNRIIPEKFIKREILRNIMNGAKLSFWQGRIIRLSTWDTALSWARLKQLSIPLRGLKAGVCLYDEGTQRILLFYCGTEETTQAYILKCLRDKVPKYMFPNLMLKLEKIPQTLNGKIDRLALKEYYDNDKQNT